MDMKLPCDETIVLDFIRRRFGEEDTNHWMDGNCYYFAQILKARFPQGILYYDLVNGHFVTCINDIYYDFTGFANVNQSDLVRWACYNDTLHKQRIIEGCVL